MSESDFSFDEPLYRKPVDKQNNPIPALRVKRAYTHYVGYLGGVDESGNQVVEFEPFSDDILNRDGPRGECRLSPYSSIVPPYNLLCCHRRCCRLVGASVYLHHRCACPTLGDTIVKIHTSRCRLGCVELFDRCLEQIDNGDYRLSPVPVPSRLEKVVDWLGESATTMATAVSTAVSTAIRNILPRWSSNTE